MVSRLLRSFTKAPKKHGGKPEKQSIFSSLPLFPPKGCISELDPIETEIYLSATRQSKEDMKNGFYDPFFDPVKYFSSVFSWTEVIIKHPGHHTPDTIRSLFDTPFRDSEDKFQQLFLLPVLIKALEREVANISDPKIISEVNLWIPVLKDIDHKERIPTEEGKMPKGFTVYFFRPYKFEFILAYVNKLPNDEKISHLIKKRAEIKEQIAFLETNPEESINERLILKQDAKRCKIEIERLTALNAVKKPEPAIQDQEPPPTTIPESEQAPKRKTSPKKQHPGTTARYKEYSKTVNHYIKVNKMPSDEAVVKTAGDYKVSVKTIDRAVYPK